MLRDTLQILKEEAKTRDVRVEDLIKEIMETETLSSCPGLTCEAMQHCVDQTTMILEQDQ